MVLQGLLALSVTFICVVLVSTVFVAFIWLHIHLQVCPFHLFVKINTSLQAKWARDHIGNRSPNYTMPYKAMGWSESDIVS